MKHSDIFKSMEGRMDFDPKIVHNFSDGLYAKEMTIPKDFFVVQHLHSFSHLSILAKGKVILRTDNSEEIYSAPACIEIKSGVHHSIPVSYTHLTLPTKRIV